MPSLFKEISEPLTEYGVQLGEAAELVAPRFHIHECGYLPHGVEGWGAQTIFSPFWRLWHIKGDGHWLESNGTRLEMSANNIVFAPAHIVFSLGSHHAGPQLWLHFSLAPDYAFETVEAFVVPVDTLLRAQLKELIGAHRALPDNGQNRIYHYAAALLHNCFARHPLALRALPETLLSLLKTIENTASCDLSNAHLARCMNMSSGHFVRWFKEKMGQTPAVYVNEARLKKASRLLLFSELSIGQIAASVGFSNRDHFSRAFSEHAGCGPATFRKKHHAWMKWNP
jgi:AraC-like DNA-binding protein